MWSIHYRVIHSSCVTVSALPEKHIMESKKIVWVFFLGLAIGGGTSSVDDNGLRMGGFPAIYNFGDSNSDTGGRSAALVEVPPPYGETFFGKPSGRLCDGRLIIDFIAEELGLPYLSAYLDSIGTSFRYGANFATGGSSILPGGYSPFHLNLQISQFKHFKSRTTSLYQQLSDNNTHHLSMDNLPIPEDFSKALYTIDIGQNDLYYGFNYSTEPQLRASIPIMIHEFAQAVHKLYNGGARYFWVFNTGPIGCLPYSVIYYQLKPLNLDKNGCVEPHNEVAREFNRQLKNRVSRLKTQFPDAAFTYVDVYSAKYELISDAKNRGFEDPLKFCCGNHYGYHVDCGEKVIVDDGTVYGNSCSNPSKYISWDGIHYTQAANLQVAQLILNRSFSVPRFQF